MSSQEKKEQKGNEKEKERMPSGIMDEWGARLSIFLGRASAGQNLRQRFSVYSGAESRLRSVTAPNSPTSDNNKEKKSVSLAPSSWNLNINLPYPLRSRTRYPVKMRNAGKPVHVPPPNGSGRPLIQGRESSWKSESAPLGSEAYFPKRRTSTLNTGERTLFYRTIQQFSESQFARQYFSTHRTGFIFRRTVPVSQMMTWRKAPFSVTLLQLYKPLLEEAKIMDDKYRDKPVNGRFGRYAWKKSVRCLLKAPPMAN
ncbi:hypothetical protein BC629DRAFT_1596970 [Irpex lacteus]|nr:hypothetical protein BC629DRAFT_1596970 [Irpex lacteus]